MTSGQIATAYFGAKPGQTQKYSEEQTAISELEPRLDYNLR